MSGADISQAAVKGHIASFFNLLEEQTGIALNAGKEYLIASRLNPIVHAHGFADAESLLRHLVSQPLSALHWRAFEAMATNETMFFRDKNPFEAIKNDLIPGLLSQNNESRTIHIWCAAASTGQEPYSIAMLLHDSFPECRDWNIQLYASDMSQTALDYARAGIYSETELRRGLTEEQIERHFTPLPSGRYEVSKNLRSCIQFLNINLVKEWPVMPPFDLILMRNILIYFNQEKKQRVITKMKAQLAGANSTLLLGASESMLFDHSFKLHHSNKISYYRNA